MPAIFRIVSDMVISMPAIHRGFTFLMFSTSMDRLESSFVILAVVSLGMFTRKLKITPRCPANLFQYQPLHCE